jgi:hypothetical protein
LGVVEPVDDASRPYVGTRGRRNTKPLAQPKPRKVFSEDPGEHAVQWVLDSGRSIRDVAKELDE